MRGAVRPGCPADGGGGRGGAGRGELADVGDEDAGGADVADELGVWASTLRQKSIPGRS